MGFQEMNVRIETQRLIIREFAEQDAQALSDAAGQPSVERWLPDWKKARAFAAHLFQKYGYDRLVASVQPENIASNRVVRKLGFTYVRPFDAGRRTGQELPFHLHRLDCPQALRRCENENSNLNGCSD
jgi:RimJ/RimL family protein N-acetyltransferase